MNQSITEPYILGDRAKQIGLGGRAALIVAHPSHELRIHGWLELARPRVFIWTDGSGRSGEPKLDWTTKVLARAGATVGGIYGRLSELEFYAAIINRDYDGFIKLTNDLASELISEQIEYIVGDAVEGRNVTHEAGRLMTGAAVELASRKSGQSIGNFDFTVLGRPDDCPAEQRAQVFRLDLDDDAFERKLAAVRSHHPKLVADVNAALGGQLLNTDRHLTGEDPAASARGAAKTIQSSKSLGDILGLLDGVDIDSFRQEYLRPVENCAGAGNVLEEPLFYEAYGEKLVAAGHYKEVIRYREHLVPLAEALWNHIERGGQN